MKLGNCVTIEVNKDIVITDCITGAYTYRVDFVDVILPYISDIQSNILITDYTVNEVKANLYDKIVQILHSANINRLNDKMLFLDKDRHVCITHYDYFLPYINESKYVSGVYIPMSIDTRKLPNPIPWYDKKDKILYYQNIYPPKKKMYEMLNSEIQMDTLSYGYLNGKQKKLTYLESISILNGYRYVITTGRGMLEALYLGCRCINAGTNYTGPIDRKNTFTEEHRKNFNTYGGMSVITKNEIERDITRLSNSTLKIPIEMIDMHTYKNVYRKAITE